MSLGVSGILGECLFFPELARAMSYAGWRARPRVRLSRGHMLADSTVSGGVAIGLNPACA
jgi:hypothetical protein